LVSVWPVDSSWSAAFRCDRCYASILVNPLPFSYTVPVKLISARTSCLRARRRKRSRISHNTPMTYQPNHNDNQGFSNHNQNSTQPENYYASPAGAPPQYGYANGYGKEENGQQGYGQNQYQQQGQQGGVTQPENTYQQPGQKKAGFDWKRGMNMAKKKLPMAKRVYGMARTSGYV
jgi:hypothetical protein